MNQGFLLGKVDWNDDPQIGSLAEAQLLLAVKHSGNVGREYGRPRGPDWE